MRTTNQQRAKQDVLAKLDSSSRLVVMDWAMKFLQLRYREKQSDWYGKRGLSWHVSSVVSRDELTKNLQVTTYAHLFDQCTQDWFAVASIIEHLLTHLKAKHPSLDSVYFRSDEAGCYHNNLLVAAVRDIGERFGITVKNYDFSEPQSGKDICDRILCPLKASIREHCSEGHDILTASDMKEALKQHPVSGTSASVNVVDKSRESLEVEHWFYSVKEIDLNPERKKQPTASESLFECSVSGCTQAFALFSELESHLNVGQHTRIQATSESFYDKVRKYWAGKFASVDVASQTKCYATSTSATSTSLATSSSTVINDTPLTMGWAINKTTSSTRFPQKVKDYLTARFLIGEKTGCKADPNQVEKDMRTSRNPSNERKFNCKEWLTKTQIKGFFSRLALLVAKKTVW
jgi:hypothetical protein